MRIERTGLALCGLVVGMLAGAAPSTASAAYVRALTASYDQNTGFNVSDTGQIAGPLATAESGPFADFGGTFHSKAYAQFSGGLGASLGTLSEMTNTYPLYQSFSPAEAWWSVTFTAGGLAGTQSSYNVGLQLHGTLTDTIYPGFPNNLGAIATADYVGLGALSVLAIHDSSTVPNPIRTVWQVITLNAGQSVTFGASLHSDASAQGGEARADMFNTGLFAVQDLTPGADYTTDNGVRFLTSFDAPVQTVPEPETYALLIAGFGVLGFALRRQRRAVAT